MAQRPVWDGASGSSESVHSRSRLLAGISVCVCVSFFQGAFCGAA